MVVAQPQELVQKEREGSKMQQTSCFEGDDPLRLCQAEREGIKARSRDPACEH